MALQLLALCFCCFVVGPTWAATASGAPPMAVARALQAAGIPLDAVGIVVQDVADPRPRLVANAQRPLNPASLMKLVTTAAALERLGPAYRWRTEVFAQAPPDAAGIIAGNIYLRGSGDPKFTFERLWLLLRELRARGIEEIRGELVLDRSAFAPIEHDPAAFDGKPQRPYNVGPDGLLFNFAALTLTLLPENGAVRLIVEPAPAGLAIVNRLRVIDGKPCPEEWREPLFASVSSSRLVLAGDYPRACGERRWHLAGLPNSELLAGVFTRLWAELGGKFSGRWREGITPAQAIPLAASESPPLAELVRDINKFSNNVMARQLYLTLGAGETARAEKSIHDWLADKGLDFPELVLDNGAGLSRSARISAGNLARLLAALWKSPVMPELVASLPIVGSDGTTKRRYNGTAFAGQAHLKTGTLEGVRGLAGYLLDRQGRWHIVVFIVNHPNAAQAQPAFDALLEWLWRGNA